MVSPVKPGANEHPLGRVPVACQAPFRNVASSLTACPKRPMSRQGPRPGCLPASIGSGCWPRRPQGVGWAVGTRSRRPQAGQGARAAGRPTGVVGPSADLPPRRRGGQAGASGCGSWTLEARTSQDQCPALAGRRPPREVALATTGRRGTWLPPGRLPTRPCPSASPPRCLRGPFNMTRSSKSHQAFPPPGGGRPTKSRRTILGGCSTGSTRPFQPQCVWRRARCPRRRAR